MTENASKQPSKPPEDLRLIDLINWKLRNGYLHRSGLTTVELNDRKIKKLTGAEQAIYDEIEATKVAITYQKGMMTLEIFKPTESLNIRDKTHWGIKIQRKAVWDGIIRKALSLYPPPFELPFNKPVVVKYQPYRKRLLDEDNSFSGQKFVIDALVFNGVLQDDSPEYVYQYFPKRQNKVKSDEAVRTVLSLIPVDPGSEVKMMIVPPILLEKAVPQDL